MQIQKSYQTDAVKGTLYVVPTPIGNLEDITIRALRILEEADAVLAEDTRNTGKLLHHFELKKKMISYHEHNKMARQDQILELLSNGENLALVSDAGMPGISDPGYEMVQAAIQSDLPVVVLPGANAALSALVGSGLPTGHFYFYGFLPRKKKDRDQAIQLLQSIDTTFILYESPHRIEETIKLLWDSLGDRQVAIARELTKRYEEYIRGSLPEIAEWITDHTIKGECCIVVEGIKENPQTNWWTDLTLKEHVEKVMELEGYSSKEAVKAVAKDRNIPKREVYSAYHME
ncbi:16S rRNA (cytidine(1402)-2'-O)-methyltransferase [Gracilibacillus salitolerans]|uniref:Ribosomal RNA small subunit methyltransferase I n=1 Tax=Gracilibacillus salitolerans TaxID=2663022 RepID=A0A5Q2TD59_9BACI|nr:16S rRNA (cytidine(1402)-2'-O)-methyltransferase [Gracilibacillus salitolerans]QGH32634.1 16S rRNA (cytidine(1402)-2'-O)-methyltransferase [Gracilibacillus salitolerans]